ncbi:hypothetical protein MKZ38_005552 [Zalerion maritima]|uniref:Uncharacterized protein n=1 Tax=Zalerion maritima TaxID=339359 RepID=A0AAD5RKL9_9PEZI|nr:hypothetical protein MKZ38_005552 [Zalerion maritima]
MQRESIHALLAPDTRWHIDLLLPGYGEDNDNDNDDDDGEDGPVLSLLFWIGLLRVLSSAAEWASRSGLGGVATTPPLPPPPTLAASQLRAAGTLVTLCWQLLRS